MNTSILTRIEARASVLDCGSPVLLRSLGNLIWALLILCTATNAVTLNIQVSNDKTNWASATPFSLSQDLTTATTNYIAFTNFPATVLNNVAWFRLATVTAANTNQITNSITWSVHQ